MTATAALPEPNRGRLALWAGVAAGVIGVPLVAVQLALKMMFTPWYSPALATLGAALILVAFMRRPGVVRGVAFVIIAAFAGLQWFFLVSLMKLPDYAGPARPGEPFPAFATTLADGTKFTEADLADGSWRAMVFFRGRW